MDHTLSTATGGQVEEPPRRSRKGSGHSKCKEKLDDMEDGSRRANSSQIVGDPNQAEETSE